MSKKRFSITTYCFSPRQLDWNNWYLWISLGAVSPVQRAMPGWMRSIQYVTECFKRWGRRIPATAGRGKWPKLPSNLSKHPDKLGEWVQMHQNFATSWPSHWNTYLVDFWVNDWSVVLCLHIFSTVLEFNPQFQASPPVAFQYLSIFGPTMKLPEAWLRVKTLAPIGHPCNSNQKQLVAMDLHSQKNIGFDPPSRPQCS